MEQTFGERVTAFLHTLSPPVVPEDITVLNPYRDERVRTATAAFYTAFFNDYEKRVFIIGINPGRFGAGATGIAFTDTDGLAQCGIEHTIPETREVSASFIDSVITHAGGPELFYAKYFLTSICPLGFMKGGVNYNYYDSAALRHTLTPYLHTTFTEQMAFGAAPTAVVLGKGKNYTAIKKLNNEYGWFETIIPLDHPRYIMQYRRREVDRYIKEYSDILASL